MSEEKVVLRVIQEENPLNPRTERENLGTMVCWHRRYSLGDEHSYSTPRDFLETLVSELSTVDAEELESMSIDELLEAISENAVIQPLYLYDHSVQSISTSSFIGRAQHAEWDSGQIGWIYMTIETAWREFGNVTEDNIHERITTCLNNEVKVYDQYMRGDVYGFILEKHTTCECCGSDNVEPIDSCWGFYGTNWKENGMVDTLPSEYVELLDDVSIEY